MKCSNHLSWLSSQSRALFWVNMCTISSHKPFTYLLKGTLMRGFRMMNHHMRIILSANHAISLTVLRLFSLSLHYRYKPMPRQKQLRKIFAPPDFKEYKPYGCTNKLKFRPWQKQSLLMNT